MRHDPVRVREEGVVGGGQVDAGVDQRIKGPVVERYLHVGPDLGILDTTASELVSQVMGVPDDGARPRSEVRFLAPVQVPEVRQRNRPPHLRVRDVEL